jgi:serine/threonine protein phosphatase 1
MKHYVMSDIHGMGSLFDEVMSFLNEQDEYQLIFLGDACDRGTDGYRIMKSLLENPNVIYLKGNHEDLFVKAVHEAKAQAL